MTSTEAANLLKTWKTCARKPCCPSIRPLGIYDSITCSFSHAIESGILAWTLSLQLLLITSAMKPDRTRQSMHELVIVNRQSL